MMRRLVAVGLLAALMSVGLASPARADAGAEQTIAEMTAHYRDPGLEPANKPFALLYLRTTEGMRDANAEGKFSDPVFWDRDVIPTFAHYYLDAYASWAHGHARAVDPAWRIAFRARSSRLTCTQLLYLGINAHVNNDLAFVIDDLGPRYRYADHQRVDGILASVGPVVYPELQRDLCPNLFSETIPPTADHDIDAWRQLAWENALRLRSAPTPRARDAVAQQIRRHARNQAREILHWNR